MNARLLGTISAFALVAAAMTTPAFAQDATGPVAAGQPEERDVIVITATKREENLQDVPIVVTAVGEQLLEDAGVNDIRDLQILTPASP